MYRMEERMIAVFEPQEEPQVGHEKRKLFSVDSLLDLTETIATMAMGAGFLLLVAAWLASF